MKVFISYRRNDTQEITNRIAKSLKRHFGESNIILDTDDFLLGSDFRAEIMKHLHESTVVIAVIGEFWHSTLAARLETSEPENPDWVMQEIETAIAENKILIPVTIDDTYLPPEDVLPPMIGSLAYKNAENLRKPPYRFEEDIQRLIRRIEKSTNTICKPQPNTIEELYYLLRSSRWEYASPNHMDEYICEQDNTYRIVIDPYGPMSKNNYHSEWADNFIDPHSTCDVYIKHNGEILKTIYFVSVWGAKYLVPLPDIDGTRENPIYYWDVNSLEMLAARHIARFHTAYTTIEEFAKRGKIEIR